MTHHEIFGPRRLGWRPVTPQGWAMLWGGLVVGGLFLIRILWRYTRLSQFGRERDATARRALTYTSIRRQ
jgi:hypothetical protein